MTRRVPRPGRETSRIGRRRFLGGAAASTLALGASAPVVRAAPVRGRGAGNLGETIRIGAIGVGGRASLLLEQLPPEA